MAGKPSLLKTNNIRNLIAAVEIDGADVLSEYSQRSLASPDNSVSSLV